MNKATFTIRKSKLLTELKKMTKALGALAKRNKNTEIEITITDGLVTLVIPGIRLELKCETVSTAKVSLNLYYFKDIVQSWNELQFQCSITDNAFNMGVTSVKVQTTFFETDSILRSIKLPINYTDLHLLQLANKGFTDEEITFNKLEYEIHCAKRNLRTNIRKTKEILAIYGVTSAEIEEIVQRKINL